MGIHPFLTFDYNITSASRRQAIAPNYSFVWGSGATDGSYYATNPNILLSYYMSFQEDVDNDSPRTDTSCGSSVEAKLCWWLHNHPTWILYSQNGRPAYYPLGGSCHTDADCQQLGQGTLCDPNNNQCEEGFVPLDISQPAVVNWEACTYGLFAGQRGYNSIAGDNVVLSNYLNAYGRKDDAGQLVQRYAYPVQTNDPVFRSDVLNWATQFGSQLHNLHCGDAGTTYSLNLVVNTNVTDPRDPSSQQLIQSVDGVLHESGFTQYGNGNLSGAAWLNEVELMEDVQALGKSFYSINESSIPYCSPGSPGCAPPVASQSATQWAVGSYLMGKEHAATVYSVPVALPTTTNPVTQYYGYEQQQPNLPYPSIGAPCGSAYPSQGVYVRDYQYGESIVNNSNVGTSVTLDSGTAFSDLFATTVGSSLTAGALSGYVLTTTTSRCTITTPIFNRGTSWTSTGNYVGWNSGTGDFNGDGATDLLLYYNDASSWRSNVTLANGSSSYGSPTYWQYPGNFSGWTEATGDFNGDGKTDLLLYANDATSWRSWVALSNGSGGFGTPVMWSSGGNFNGWTEATGDFNGDGKTDLLLYANDATSWRSRVALSNGSGGFGTPVTWSSGGNFTGWTEATGDFDADGKTDIVLYANDTAGWRSWVAFSNGAGSFSNIPTSWTWTLPSTFNGYASGVADVNGDGRTDLMLYANDDTGWRAWAAFSAGTGNFGRPVPWADLGPFSGLTPETGRVTGTKQVGLLLAANDASSWRAWTAASSAH